MLFSLQWKVSVSPRIIAKGVSEGISLLWEYVHDQIGEPASREGPKKAARQSPVGTHGHWIDLSTPSSSLFDFHPGSPVSSTCILQTPQNCFMLFPHHGHFLLCDVNNPQNSPGHLFHTIFTSITRMYLAHYFEIFFISDTLMSILKGANVLFIFCALFPWDI